MRRRDGPHPAIRSARNGAVNILFLCHRFPFPPNRGGRIRPFHIVRHFAAHHRVTLASLLHPGDDDAAVAALEAVVPRVIAERVEPARQPLRALERLVRGGPPSFGYFWSPALAERLRRLVAGEAFDLVFVHCSSMAPYVEDVRAPKILDFGDMDSQKWLAYAAHRRFPLSRVFAVEGRRLQAEEARLAARFDLSTCTTPAEVASLHAIAPAAAGDWFVNGVDHEYFAPAGEAGAPDAVCFLGRMDYYPNAEAMVRFCRETWPLLRRLRPNATLTIVGASPGRAVRRLGRLPGVRVTGTVADVRPYARHCRVSVAPLAIARGTQNKILESMAMGLAVVASSSAAAGTDTRAGEHLLVADEPRAMGEAIASLLGDEPARARLAAAGRQRVRARHDWAASMQRLDRLAESVAAAGPAAAPGRA